MEAERAQLIETNISFNSLHVFLKLLIIDYGAVSKHGVNLHKKLIYLCCNLEHMLLEWTFSATDIKNNSLWSMCILTQGCTF